MTEMSKSPFGDPLPIFLDRIRPALDELDPATRLEAVSAALPVYDQLAQLRDRVLAHRGGAFITILGWLREDRFVFGFELCRERLEVVGFAFEPGSDEPDEPDGALACIVNLKGRSRILAVRVPQRARSPRAAVGAVPELANEAIQYWQQDRVTAEPLAGRSDEWERRMPATRHRVALVQGLAEILVMARSAIAIDGPRSKSAVDTRSSFHAGTLKRQLRQLALADALAFIRNDLRCAVGALSTATVRAAERLCRAALAKRRPGEPVVVLLADLIGREGRSVSVYRRRTATPRVRSMARDGERVRVLINLARCDLEQALVRSMTEPFASGEADHARDFGTTIADLVSGPPQAFRWAELTSHSEESRDEHNVSMPLADDDPDVLTAERGDSGRTGPVFFVHQHRTEPNSGNDEAGQSSGS